MTEEKLIEKKCVYCGGEIWPINKVFKLNGEEAYQKFREQFKKDSGLEWKESLNYNCCECGMIYNELLMPTGNSVIWLGSLKEVYRKYKAGEIKIGIN